MLVMKFGGTSIQNAGCINRVKIIIKEKLVSYKNMVVVVSAFGKVTNKLTLLGRTISSGKVGNYKKLFSKLKSYHEGILKKTCENKKLLTKALHALNKEFDKINKTSLKIKNKPFTGKRSDSVVSFGEKLSSIIVSAAFASYGIKTKLVNASEFMITDNNYTKANPQFNIVYKKLPGVMNPHFSKYKVVLTQGFIGRTKKGLSTTIGREGSDCTAAIIGAGLGAQKIEIWTDVNGVMTADPRIVKKAKNIPEISYNDMAQLSFCGAKVIHPGTVAPAKEKNIPVYVLNSYNKNAKGTVIYNLNKKYNKINDIIGITCKPDFDEKKAYIYIIGRNIVYIGNLRLLIDDLIENEKVVLRGISKSNITLAADINMAENIICYLHKKLIEN